MATGNVNPDFGAELSPAIPFSNSRGFTVVTVAVLAALACVLSGIAAKSLAYRTGSTADTVGTALVGIGVLAVAAAAAAAIWNRMHPWSVQLFEQGLLFRRGSRLRRIPFENLQGIRASCNQAFANGQYSGRSFTLALWNRVPITQPASISVSSTLSHKKPACDQFGEMYPKLLERVAAVFEARLQRGERLQGEGFAMDSNGLRIGTDSVPLERLSCTAVYDDQLCVWKTGETVPSYRLPMSRTNIVPVLLLLGKRLSGKDAAEVPGLGRLLFERKPGAFFKATIALCVLGALALGAAFLCGGMEVRRDDAMLGGGVCAAVALTFAAFLAHLCVAAFRCHEKGVFRKGLLSQRELRYENIATFKYEATRHYHNGAYTGTAISLAFRPAAKSRLKPITYSTMIRDPNKAAELDELRDHISKVIGVRQLKQVEAGEAVPWGSASTIVKAGVSYRAPGLFGRAPAVLLPFERIAGANLNQGVFFLFEEGKEKPVFSMAVSEPNFFPGLITFSVIKYPPADEDKTAAPAAPPAVKPPA